jgi:uncharacterized protein YuzE
MNGGERTTITIGPWVFDHVVYDEDADVAYLTIGEPRRAVGEETPEGHIQLFDEETGEFCGLTLIGVQRIFDGELPRGVTVPERNVSIEDKDLRTVLA